MPFVDVEAGVALHVQDLGGGGDRPDAVFVAGFGMDHRVWDRQVRVLADRGHRVVCVDQRGHGRSDHPLTGYDVPRLGADLERVLEALDVVDSTLVGWSFGGQTAFAVAASGSKRVARLALVGSNGVRASRSEAFPFGRPPGPSLEALLAAEHGDRIASRREAIRSGFAAPPAPDLLEHLLRISLEMPSWAASSCYRSMLEADLVDGIDRVTLPVLQVIGETDPVHSARGARWLAQRLPDSRLVELPGCGHYPMFEEPDAFDRALIAFADPAYEEVG